MGRKEGRDGRGRPRCEAGGGDGWLCMHRGGVHCSSLGIEVPHPEQAGQQAMSPVELERRLPGMEPRIWPNVGPAT